MPFLRVDENITVNTEYIVKVKWKLNSDTDELSGSVFITGGDKTEVVAVKGNAAYKLWDILHAREDLPRNKQQDEENSAEWKRTRRGW